ncbi:MAG: hypothetical protein IPP90_10500 [Gemmatimonadaceae bacterium]|nr:hypothetical protein [Gemmatimonadaceae bacterium]
MSVRNPIVVQFVLHKLARLATPVLLVIAMAAGLQPAAQTAMRFPVAVATVVGLVLTLVLIVAPLRQRVGTTLSWMLSLQLATFRAVANGFHGRWGVWKRH